MVDARMRSAAALAAFGLASVVGARAGAAEVYEFDVPMAPVCVDGSFPLHLGVGDGAVEGTLAVTTDVAGRVSGTLDVAGEVLDVSGRVRHRDHGSTLVFSAGKGGARLTFRGALAGGAFVGASKGGRSSPAPGRNDGEVGVSAAAPQVATLTVVLDDTGAPRLTGSGEARVCGAPLALAVRGREGAAFLLDLAAKGFRWKGSGPAGEALRWTIRGYGARASGDGLVPAPLLPPEGLAYAGLPALIEAEEPLPPATPTVGGGRVREFTVAPPLPEGLVLDRNSGAISGTPAGTAPGTIHVFTASNAAGFASVALPLAVRVNRAHSLAPHGEPLTDDDRRHFLARTRFGVRASDLADLEAAGLAATVDAMLAATPDSDVEAAARALLVNESDPPGLEGGFPTNGQLARWWSYLLMHGGEAFVENLAVFWQDHFAVTADVLAAEQRHWMPGYVDLLRWRGRGNLRDLLVDVARHPAMLRFLDGFSNQRRAPNENFAREFWELYTLGVDNGYTQADILEAARAFTGWRTRLDVATGQHYAEFAAGRHDAGAKTVFGVLIPGQEATDDFEAVVDITLAERPVAEFIARKLLRWYCLDDPADALVADMAAVLRGSGWELAPALRAMFLSEAFFSKRARRAQVKSPVDFGVGFIRSTGLVVAPNVLDSYLSLLGQRVTAPPTVDGWPAGTMWISAAAMVDRTNLAQAVILDVVNQGRLGIDVADILPPPEQRSAGAVVDHLAALLRVDLSPEDRADLVSYLDTVRQGNGTVTPSPFDGSNRTHLDERVRGLLYVLAQHPTFHTR